MTAGDPTLWETEEGQVRLLGSRCAACGAVAFPAQGSCPRCTSTDTVPHRLASEGVLWSWTVQRFSPKEPFVGAGKPFRPFGVGYVDLDGEVIVEGRINGSSEGLAIGTPVRVVIEDLDGHPTYAFASVREQGGERSDA